ncbi:alpha-2,8-polysialyltransferase family protein [Ensifer sp. 22460]|uniref:alpha-2,8-polysialyltransferase family protein n=1 Tax=Ensifer sp. 22460 TaxID=3453922 RepID=UPI003F85B240
MTSETETFLPAVDMIVVSNSRQALNASAFIKVFGSRLRLSPFVLALYTDANLKEKGEIAELLTMEKIPHKIVRLPIGAAYYSLRRQTTILGTYRKVFTAFKPHRVFLFNYNTHYGFVYDLARQSNVSVFFIEEGLSSYKNTDRYAPPRSLVQIIDQDIISDSFFGKLLLKAPYQLVRHPKRVLGEIVGFLKNELAFAGRCFAVPFDNEYSAARLSRLFGGSYYYRRFHNPISGFDGVWGTFPDRLAKRFACNEKTYYSYLKNTFERAHDVLLTKLEDTRITNKSILFADQAYEIDKTVVVEVIAKWIADDFPDTDTLFIKPHPKARFSPEKFAALRRTQPQLNIKLLPYTDIPAEFIPALTACRRIVGIASSTLVYARDICPEVETYSIYRRLLPLIQSDRRVAQVIKEHGITLEQFPDVRFV